MLKAPFRSPNKIIITQEFGDITRLAYYKANGINAPFHNGIDLVVGDSRITYGTEIICPFPKAKVIKVTWDSPSSTKGNGVTIESDFEGFKYQVVLWHTSEIVCKLGQELKEGDVICYIGNSGLCNPPQTEAQPWNGSHCHLMLFKYKFNGLNWILQDADNGVYGARNPRELFDFTQSYLGKDTGFIRDMWAIQKFVIGKTGDTLVKYFRTLGL